MNTDSIAAYERPARVASYDADMDVMHPIRHKMVDIALEILPFEPQSAITALDLGTGVGYFTQKFLELEATDQDQPLGLGEDMQVLQTAGLSHVALFWSEYREVVIGGRK